MNRNGIAHWPGHGCSTILAGSRTDSRDCEEYREAEASDSGGREWTLWDVKVLRSFSGLPVGELLSLNGGFICSVLRILLLVTRR